MELLHDLEERPSAELEELRQKEAQSAEKLSQFRDYQSKAFAACLAMGYI